MSQTSQQTREEDRDDVLFTPNRPVPNVILLGNGSPMDIPSPPRITYMSNRLCYYPVPQVSSDTVGFPTTVLRSMEELIQMTSAYLNAAGNVQQYVGDLTVYPETRVREITEAFRYERQLMIHMKSYVDGNLTEMWERVKHVWDAVAHFNKQLVEAHDKTAQAVLQLVNGCDGLHHGLQMLLTQDLPGYIE